MKYYKFTSTTPYCGTDSVELVASEKPLEQWAIDELCEEYARENGETYSYLATGWDGDWETEEDEEEYFVDCLCTCKELTFEEWVEEMDNQGLL